MTAQTDTPSDSGPSRRLATVATVESVRDIPAADNIVVARVRGWDVVVKRGEFRPGDRCVYVEVDSLLDVTDERFAFLAPRGVQTDPTGVSGHVLKTARLRGQYSQGLALPVDAFPEATGATEGADLTELLHVRKWEPPVPAELMGQVRGHRPSWIPATDEDRLQNLPEILGARAARWTATEKVDGTSATFYVDPSAAAADGCTGVCSRNLDLLDSDRNTLWRLARETAVHALLAQTFPGLRSAVQGEAFGEGVQGNPLRIRGQRFLAFTLQVDGADVPRDGWPGWLLALSVPVLRLAFPGTLDDALGQVETLRSMIEPDRPAEGVVWRAIDRATVTTSGGEVLRASFKVISRRYLLKQDR